MPINENDTNVKITMVTSNNESSKITNASRQMYETESPSLPV